MLKSRPCTRETVRRLFCLVTVLGIASACFGATKEKWLKVQAGHFTVLTPSTEANARKWAAELQQFEIGLQKILPVVDGRLRPVTVVLFRTDKSLRPYKPLEKGKPQEVAGFFVQVQDSHAIALALDYDPEEIRAIVYHEAVHWYTSASDKRLPPWLDEGLAEVYATFHRKEDGRYSFGEAVREHLGTVQNGKLIPVEQLVSVAHGSLEYSDRNRTTMFYAESWALVHYLLFGRDMPGMESIARYVQATETAGSPDAAFRAAFNANCAEMEMRLATYVRSGIYRVYNYKIPDGDGGEKLAVTSASEGEVELALGVLLLGGRGEASEEAALHLQRAAALAPNKPEVWQARGEAALAQRDYAAASDYFSRAAKAGSTSYMVYYGLGWTRLHDQQVAGTYFDSSELVHAAADLRRAIELNPRFIPAYESLAGILWSLDSHDARDRALMEHARVLAPDSALIDVGLSACDFKSGQTAVAKQRLELVLAAKPDSQGEAQRLAQLMLKDVDWNETSAKVESLFNQKRYVEVVALIDSVSPNFDDSRYRQVLATNRRIAVNAQRVDEAIVLINAGNTDEGRALLEKMLAENPPPELRTELKRLLKDLETLVAERARR